MIRFIYRLFKKQIHNLLIEDLLLNMPNKVGQPAIQIMGGKREQVVKWLYFEVNAISRRNPVDFGSLERRNGMLIMIKAMLLAVSNPLISGKEEMNPQPMEKPRTVKDWKPGIETFKSKISTVDK